MAYYINALDLTARNQFNGAEYFFKFNSRPLSQVIF
jgi:hypothetical protein